MAISNYLQTCEYKLGGLKPFIYVIHKNALKLNIKAKGIEVNFNKTKESDVYKIEAQMVTYEQQETYANKFRFDSSVKVLINEQYKEPFFYGLRTLRTNQYYIIIEDKKGVQYLVNPELYTKMTYEYTFTDTVDNHNSVEITWNNLSNFPLLIFKERVESNLLLLGEECFYTIGNAYNLVMTRFQDLHTKDDGVKAEEIYVDDITKLKEVQYLKESFTLTEMYDGNKFTTELTFSIPLSDHQFEWAYDLLEFKDNTYKGLVRTTNDNYLLLGNENGLFPSYTIRTSEDDGTLNTIEFKFTHISQYPILYTDEIRQYKWIPDGELCFGFDKYQMLRQQYSKDWGETWVDTDPIVKKKGDVIASNTDECKEYRWVDDDLYCEETDTIYVKWLETEGQFLCENGNKYSKLRKYESSDEITYTAKEEYAKGRIIESNSTDCTYIAVKWVDDGYNCYEVNEGLNERGDKIGEECSGTTLMNKYSELVTHNGVDYFESGEFFYDEEITNCCACGYREEDWRINEYICGKDISSQYDPYTLYGKNQKYLICTDERTSVDEMTDDIEYTVQETECCECGWTGLTWVFNDEYVCGSEIEDVVIGNLAFISTSGDWLQEGYTFTSNKIGNSQITVQRIYFQLLKPSDIIFDIVQSSEVNYDYLIISNLDSSARNTTTSGLNFCNWKGKTNGTTAMTISDSDEHFIELMYRKDSSQSSGSDNVIVTISSFAHLENYKYEIWREAKACDVSDFTGNVKYLNGVPSYDCGLITYQWREDIEVCGTELPENITVVDEAPEINTDFE